MPEYEFISQLVNKTGCELLIDINNLYVSSKNSGFNSVEYISNLPHDSIKEIHLAGYEDRKIYLYDTHGRSVHDEVWHLFNTALDYFGNTLH